MAIYLLFCSPLSSPPAPPLPSPPPIFFHHRICRHHRRRRILQSWSGRRGRRPYKLSAPRRARARASAALALQSIKTSFTDPRPRFSCFSCPCLLIVLADNAARTSVLLIFVLAASVATATLPTSLIVSSVAVFALSYFAKLVDKRSALRRAPARALGALALKSNKKLCFRTIQCTIAIRSLPVYVASCCSFGSRARTHQRYPSLSPPRPGRVVEGSPPHPTQPAIVCFEPLYGRRRRQGRPTPTVTQSGRARTGPGPSGERAKTPPGLARFPRAAIIRVSGSACVASASRRPILQGQIPAAVRAAGQARRLELLGGAGAARLPWDAAGLAAAGRAGEAARPGQSSSRTSRRMAWGIWRLLPHKSEHNENNVRRSARGRQAGLRLIFLYRSIFSYSPRRAFLAH